MVLTGIIGVDLNPAKVEAGYKFGMTDFTNPSKIDNDKVGQPPAD